MLALPSLEWTLSTTTKPTAISTSTFLGETVHFNTTSISISISITQHVRRTPVITATIKRKKDYVLDKVIEREKKVKVVNKVKNLLVKRPGKVMSLRDLGKYRHHIGLPGKRRFVALLRKFPGVFKVFEEGTACMYCSLTTSAAAQYREEIELKKQLEDTLVFRLRKLLMMSVDHRILISKIVHLKQDLGLPDNFQNDYVVRYPNYFKRVDTPLGPALEVNEWDPELAVTFDEKKKQGKPKIDYEELTVSGRVPKFPVLDLPKGHKLPRKEKEKLLKFQAVRLISPYEDAKRLDPSSKEAERRAVAVVQELLHLTVAKKTLVDHLTHFRSDFRFSQRVRSMLIRHPEVFYVSIKGIRDSVFLREAYDDNSELLEKDPMVVVREKLAELVKIGRQEMRALESESEGESEDDGSWSDDEDMNNEAKVFLEEKRREKELALSLRPKVEPW